MKKQEYIEVVGARVHNLKNINVQIPRQKLTVITGLSGSGKSSLAFDTIFAEGQRRYIDTFSSYARGYIGNMQRPDVDKITGLSPVISIDQKTTSKNPRSTVGTITEVYDYLRLLFARAGVAHSYISGKPMVKYTDEQIAALIEKDYAGKKLLVLAPMVQNRKGHYKELFETMRKKGYLQARVDGEVVDLVPGMKLDRYKNHTIEVVVDKLAPNPPSAPFPQDAPKGRLGQGGKLPSEVARGGEIDVKGERTDEGKERADEGKERADEGKKRADEGRKRILRSIDTAMTQGNGVMAIALWGENDVRYFSRTLMDPENGLSYQEPAPHTFSFNSPSGWCPCCKGLGKIKAPLLSAATNPEDMDEEEFAKVMQGEDWYERLVEPEPLSRPSGAPFPQDAPDGRLGQGELPTADDEEQDVVCPECGGKRLSKESLSYTFAGKNIAELSEMDLEELEAFLRPLMREEKEAMRDERLGMREERLGISDKRDVRNEEAILTEKQRVIAEPILKEICTRIQFMLSVGLSYLSLGRSSQSLSGGESQRIRLATQIGSRLVNVLYILDEPSIGLHQRDNDRLIASLKELRDMGNSVIVVEHDEQMMREADYVVDIGPKAGRLGGEVVFQGTPEELLKADTMTAQYLKPLSRHSVAPFPQDAPDGRLGQGELPTADEKMGGNKANGAKGKLPTADEETEGNKADRVKGKLPTADEKMGGNKADRVKGKLVLRGCRGNNLKDVTVEIPLGQMVCVTGVSGSGKSTLINQTLSPILSQHFYRSLKKPLEYESIEGLELLDKVITVDQSPIGRTPRSNPATYTDVFTDIRSLFSQLPEAKIRSWKPGRFSFNAKGGRCEECGGMGVKTIQMHFMPDVMVPCECCNGLRYNKETLEVRFKGKSIGEVLDMTINQAVEFFDAQPAILRKIKTIQEVGLGYVKLGQASTTLSGGESQRIKLAAELSRPSTGKTLFILDEPTTGLHFEDIRVLMGVLRKLVDKGNTVLIIEHNLDVIRAADWLIDMGPEGGRGGGKVVACGTVEDVKKCGASLTGRYL